MLHGCGSLPRKYFVGFVIVVFGFCSSATSAIAAPATSIGDRLVNILMNDGSTQKIKLRDAFLNQGVPEDSLDEAFMYFDQNQSQIPNQKYITIIDFSQHSTKERMYLGNLTTGTVAKMLVAHGKGSDKNHDGMADSFSNVPGSQASSLGFYLVAETYFGKHGYSVRMDGLSETNSNARDRAVVIHGADYVQPGLNKLGRSFGCPAIENGKTADVIDRIKDGSLMFITVSR